MVRVGLEQHVIELYHHEYTGDRGGHIADGNQHVDQRAGGFHDVLLQSRGSKWSRHSAGQYPEFYDAASGASDTHVVLTCERFGGSTDKRDSFLECLARGGDVQV